MFGYLARLIRAQALAESGAVHPAAEAPTRPGHERSPEHFGRGAPDLR